METAQRRRQILSVVLVYGVVAVFWIATTDPLVEYFVSNARWRLLINTFKGWAFVLITAVLLWFLLQRMMRQYGQMVDQERSVGADQLLQSEQRYRMLFDANPLPMWLFDPVTFRFLAVNDAAVSSYGYSREEFLSMTVMDIRPPEDVAKLTDYFRSARQEGTVDLVYRGSWRHRRKSGEVFDVDIMTGPLAAEENGARLVMARDITQEVWADQALRASQKKLSELAQLLLRQEQQASARLARVLHDQLGQTLVVCKLLVEAAASDADPVSRNAVLKQAETQLDSATKWVRQMLVELRPPLLEEQGLVAALQAEINVVGMTSKDIQLTLETDQMDVTQRWSSEVEYATFMIVRAALSNAVQHAQATQVTVRIQGNAEQLTVEVQDNGKGLTADAISEKPGHLGLVSMRERASQIHANLSVGPGPSGGVQVTLDWRKVA